MINVWAYRKQNLGAIFRPSGEWDRVMDFDTLPELLEKFRKANFPQGQIRKLGIVAHGDEPGKVQIPPDRPEPGGKQVDLTVSTVDQFAKDLAALADYMWVNARIIFYSCIAGQGPDGSKLLNKLSGVYFRDRHVIGFEQYGVANDGEQPAGELRCSQASVMGTVNPKFYCNPTATMKTVTDVRRQAEQFLSEYAIYAKWSYHGRIIKIPYSEIRREMYSTPEVICGPDAVKRALKSMSDKIEYIFINTKSPSNKLINLFVEVQEAGFRSMSTMPKVPRTLREFSEIEKELTQEQKRQLRKHEEVVAVTRKTLTSTKFKCAWVSCASHANVEDYCPQGLEHIPNNPLE